MYEHEYDQSWKNSEIHVSSVLPTSTESLAESAGTFAEGMAGRFSRDGEVVPRYFCRALSEYHQLQLLRADRADYPG